MRKSVLIILLSWVFFSWVYADETLDEIYAVANYGTLTQVREYSARYKGEVISGMGYVNHVVGPEPNNKIYVRLVLDSDVRNNSNPFDIVLKVSTSSSGSLSKLKVGQRVYFSGPFQGITKFTGGKGGYIVIFPRKSGHFEELVVA
jgi:hypothetical protein